MSCRQREELEAKISSGQPITAPIAAPEVLPKQGAKPEVVPKGGRSRDEIRVNYLH